VLVLTGEERPGSRAVRLARPDVGRAPPVVDVAERRCRRARTRGWPTLRPARPPPPGEASVRRRRDDGPCSRPTAWRAADHSCTADVRSVGRPRGSRGEVGAHGDLTGHPPSAASGTTATWRWSRRRRRACRRATPPGAAASGASGGGRGTGAVRRRRLQPQATVAARRRGPRRRGSSRTSRRRRPWPPAGRLGGDHLLVPPSTSTTTSAPRPPVVVTKATRSPVGASRGSPTVRPAPHMAAVMRTVASGTARVCRIRAGGRAGARAKSAGRPRSAGVDHRSSRPPTRRCR
jgi:hypothetical protein